MYCPSHHRAVHEGCYLIVALGGGEFRFRTPDGRDIPQHPERAAPGLTTAPASWPAPAPVWGGEHLDLDQLISGLAANHLNDAGNVLPDLPAGELHRRLRKATGWPSDAEAPGTAA